MYHETRELRCDMLPTIPADLLSQTISRGLLSLDPNPAEMQDWMRAEYDFSAQDSQRVIYEVVRNVNRSMFPPISQLELIHTEGCNLACTYCFEREMLGYKRMPIEIAKSAVDLLID